MSKINKMWSKYNINYVKSMKQLSCSRNWCSCFLATVAPPFADIAAAPAFSPVVVFVGPPVAVYVSAVELWIS